MKGKDLETKRKEVLEYSRIIKEVTQPKIFPELMAAIEAKDTAKIDSILDKIEVPATMRDHLKLVMYTQPMLAAPTWG